MNRIIAEVFADMLSVVHVLFLLAVVAVVVLYNNGFPYLSSIPGVEFYLGVFAVLVEYVLLMGLLTTIVAMNENLVLMREQMLGLRTDLYYANVPRPNGQKVEPTV